MRDRLAREMIHAIYATSLRRTQTARPLADHLGLPMRMKTLREVCWANGRAACCV